MQIARLYDKDKKKSYKIQLAMRDKQLTKLVKLSEG
jgi:hypothetical protein